MTIEELKNYTPKGQLEGFPKEIISRMLDCQEEQGNPRDISIFEGNNNTKTETNGFDWDKTKEGHAFWFKVINEGNFDLFFERYPKKDKQNNPQDFRINDKVYDILLKEVGVVQDITYSPTIAYGLTVGFKLGLKVYTTNGCYTDECKNPQLLHYRNDYNYDVIDFSNLPKRQEPNRWRAKKDGVYNFVSFYNGCCFFSDVNKDEYNSFDNDKYNSGNYFRTEVEAEIIAQKLNTYFKQLIKEEHEYEKH